ncbi:MAG: hypothetical protein IBX72_00605 [Nitrospirae bacterium]|nr:hypothetical protein [Nitrospirota bacterium]
MIEEKIKIVTFRDSKESFLSLLDENNFLFIEQVPHPGVVMATGEIVEILKAVGAASIFPSLAAVAVQWLKARSSRKLMLQTKDKQIVHLEGYSVQEVAELLKQAESLTVIDTKSNKAN